MKSKEDILFDAIIAISDDTKIQKKEIESLIIKLREEQANLNFVVKQLSNIEENIINANKRSIKDELEKESKVITNKVLKGLSSLNDTAQETVYIHQNVIKWLSLKSFLIVLILTLFSSTAFIYFGLKYLPNIIVKPVSEIIYLRLNDRFDEIKEMIKEQENLLVKNKIRNKQQ